jgi:AraC-like DNA-binding protein
MRFQEFTRSPASALLLFQFGEERGLPPSTLLAGTGLSVVQLEDPNTEVTAAQELSLTANLLRGLGNPPGLGFEVGSRYRSSAYGVWGYGLIASATARDALALALRFLPLTYAFSVITYREGDEGGVLEFGAPALPGALSRFCVERDMAAAAVLLQEMMDEDGTLLGFTMQGARGTLARSPRIAGVEVSYGARLNSLVFDRSRLDRKLPQANAITATMCEQMCARLLETRRALVSVSAMIRHYLHATQSDGPLSLTDMARMMNLSERTLKRRLQQEGTTFRALLDESRSAAATALLADAGLRLTDVAERLGFADLSSFSQTFKRWFGVAPQVYRAGMVSGRGRDGGGNRAHCE